MVTCPHCEGEMKRLFLHTSFFCPNDCDKKKQTGPWYTFSISRSMTSTNACFVDTLENTRKLAKEIVNKYSQDYEELYIILVESSDVVKTPQRHRKNTLGFYTQTSPVRVRVVETISR